MLNEQPRQNSIGQRAESLEDNSFYSYYSLFGWTRSLVGVLLVMFVIGSMFLKGNGQLRLVGIILGLTLLVSYGFRLNLLFKCLFPVPLEIWLYTAWVVWAGITGPLSAINIDGFWMEYKVIAQILLFVWIAYCILKVQKKAASGIFVGIICGGLIQIVATLLKVQSFSSGIEDERAIGLSDNSNDLGFMMVWAVISALFLWMLPVRNQKLLRLGVLALLPLCGYVMIASGSRKCLLAFIFMLALWSIWASVARKGWISFIIRIVLASAFTYLIMAVFPFIMEQTVIGQRFASLTSGSDGTLKGAAEGNIRYWMYVEGWKMFLANPIFGVGIGNFGNHFWSGHYSHSDYMEPLATTGFIGFILYQSFNIIVLHRSFRLMKYVRDDIDHYRLKMIIICILTNMFLGGGAPWSTSLQIYSFLVLASTYTAELQRKLSGLSFYKYSALRKSC